MWCKAVMSFLVFVGIQYSLAVLGTVDCPNWIISGFFVAVAGFYGWETA